MKNSSIIIFLTASCIWMFQSCNLQPKEKTEVQQLQHFMDSLQLAVETFHATPDTMFIETPIDPEDPLITEVKTEITNRNATMNYFHYDLIVGDETYRIDRIDGATEAYNKLIAVIDETKLTESEKAQVQKCKELFQKLTTEFLSDSTSSIQ
jgi:hypothetical protein